MQRVAIPLAICLNFCVVSSRGGDIPLPAGFVTNLLHLGVNESDRITGFPTSAQNGLWDFMQFAGVGPEHLQQPKANQSIDMRVSVSSGGTILSWTALTDSDTDGRWKEGVGDDYVSYFALYVFAPSTRNVRLEIAADDVVRGWLDNNSSTLFVTPPPGGISTTSFSLSAGYHCFLFKLHEMSGGDFFGVKFTHPDTSDMTDLLYTLSDPIAPTVVSSSPANGATGVATWSDVLITFSEVMDTTVDPNTVASLSGAPAGTWSWADQNTLMFMPSTPLLPHTTYTATLNPTNAKDISGNSVSGGTSRSFTTQATLSTPSISSLTPTLGSAAVLRYSLNGAGFIEGNTLHPANAIPFTNGHYYRFTKEMTDWHTARDLSLAADGHLATLQNAGEDAFVWNLGGKINCWMGLTDEVTEGTFVWVTGEAVPYTNWAPTEPSNTDNVEHYGIYWYGLQWNDVPSATGSQRPYVTEFEKRQPPSVRLVKAGQSDLIASSVRWVNGGALEFDIDLTGAVNGAWDVVVRNPDGGWVQQTGAFSIDNTSPRVTAMTPTPGDVLATAPTQVLLTFSESVASSSITTSSLRLIRRGQDGQFDTADDVTITPFSVTLLTPTQAKMDLTGSTLANDVYRVISGSSRITSGLAAEWRFDEGTGTSAADSSGSGRNGTLNGSTWVSGVRGSALRFNGSTDTFEIGSGDLGAPWSCAMWVKRENSSNPSSNMFFSNSYCLKLEQYNNLKTVGITPVGNGDYAFNYEATENNWVHLTYVGTSTTTALYVNGTLQDTLNVGIGMPLTRIGNPNHSLKGTLDEIKVFSRALSAGEIATLASVSVSDLAGNGLDGEFSGTFPSGNASASGDFVAEFTVQTALFQDISASLFPVLSGAISWGDYDNDGDLDLAYQGKHDDDNVARLYRNNGNGTFSNVATPLIGFWEGMLEWGDFNGDGRVDIAETGWDGGGTGTAVWRNDGGGALTRDTFPFRGMKQGDGHWADFDNDGLLDLLTTGESYDTGMSNHSEIYRNTGTTFQLWKTFTGAHYGDCAVSDIDNDGDMDVLITGGFTKLFRNDGNGVFTELSHTIPALDGFSTVVFGDYDNDGDFDLAVAGNASSGRFCDIFRNNGGVFVAQNAGLPGLSRPTLAWGDIDNDGDLDLLLAGDSTSGDITRLYRNNAGVFTLLSEPLPGVQLADAKFADFDNDGRVDFALAGSDLTAVYKNVQATIPNTPPTAPPNPQTAINGTSVTFSWDAAGDDTTPVLGLSYNIRVGSAAGLDDVFAGMSDDNGLRRVAQWGNAQKLRQWKLKLQPGTYYWNVQAIDAGLRGGAWSSTQSFYVSGATVDVTSPNGGEILFAGQSSTITWTTSGFTGNVELAFSSNGGASYSVIATVPHSPGSYNWTVPNTPSSTCKVRVRRAAGGQPVDESDAIFIISPPAARVIALSPTPGSTLATPLTQVVATFDTAINPATISQHSFRLLGTGPDGLFDTTDDKFIVPTGVIALNSTQAKLDLAGVTLANGAYRVLIEGTQHSLRFDGGADVVFVADQPIYQLISLTVEAWVKIDAAPGHYCQLVFRGDDRVANDPFSLGLEANGRPYFRIDTPNGTFQVTAASPLTFGEWTHLSGTYDSSLKQLRLLKNGVQIAGIATSADPLKTLSGSGQGVCFGNLPDTTTGHNGLLSEVRIWNVARSAMQIQSAMNAPLVGSESGLVGYWRLNEGAGQRVYDLTVNANHGVLGLTAVATSDDPTWFATAPFAGVLDVNSRALDGEYSGTLPSGNGIAGGDFVATLELNAQPPVTTNQSFTGTEDTTLNGTLTATDANNQALTFSLINSTSNGTIQLDASGAFTFVPNLNYSGTDSFMFTASDGTLTSNVGIANLTIAPVNDPPVAAISTSSGTMFHISEPIDFSSAGSSDIDGFLSMYRFDFGDGTVVESPQSQASHFWITAGVYTVTLTVTDAGGLQASASMTVVVAAGSGAIGTLDSDGDGFSDEMEVATQTDPLSALSTPMDNKPLKEVRDLHVDKLNISLNLSLKNKDSITLIGTLQVPDKFAPTEERLVVDVGGVIRTFTLDAKGASISKPNQLRLQLKRKKVVVSAQSAKYTLQLKLGNFADDLNTELGIGTDQKNVKRSILVTVIFNRSYYEKLVTLNVATSLKSVRAK